MSPARPLKNDLTASSDTLPGGTVSPRPAPLTEAELGALVAAANGRGVTAARNRALVALLAGSGCKLGEALALRDVDIDLEQATLCVRDAQGEPRRTARLLPAAAPHVEAWRLVRRHLGGALDLGEEEQAPFFCTRRGGQVESSYVRRLLPRLAAEAGIERSVNAGLLRATFAAHVYRLGARLPEVQRLLGHLDARSTLHLVRPVLNQAPSGRDPVFRPEQWSLPGTEGTLQVQLTLREAPRRDTEGDADAWQEQEQDEQDEQEQTMIVPVQWREI